MDRDSQNIIHFYLHNLLISDVMDELVKKHRFEYNGHTGYIKLSKDKKIKTVIYDQLIRIV